jgi:molybdate transport system substrate-binding protein
MPKSKGKTNRGLPMPQLHDPISTLEKLETGLWSWLTLMLLVSPFAALSYATEIRVFAAASLTESLKEIATGYTQKTGDRIVFNLGASSTLARQIEEGAPADIFFSADESQMDRLETKNLIVRPTRKNRLSNSLVIIVASENGADVAMPGDLATSKVKRLALGDPRAVPIGVYAKKYLQELKLWSAIAPKVVATENVRAALAAVEAGNADASIVYKTDAAISKKVRVVFEVPAREGPAIKYPAALVKGSAAPAPAKNFLEYLDSDEACSIFRKHGFVVIPASISR